MSGRFSEIRLVTPVVVGWWVLFLFLCASVYINQWWDEWSFSLIFSMVCVGLWMVVVWLSLYGKMSFLRLLMLMAGLVTLPCLPLATAVLFSDGIRGIDVKNFLEMVGLCLLALIPIVWVRQFLGWRIVDETDCTVSTVLHFTLKSMFLLTTIVAASAAVAWALTTFQHISPRTASRVFLSGLDVVVSITCVMLFLSAMSRFRVRHLCFIALLLAALVTVFHWLRHYGHGHELMFFFPTFAEHLCAGVLIAVSAYHLHLKGVLFRFGGTAGFAARREAGVGIPRYLLVGALAGLIALPVVSGGWFYYQHWLVTRWQIPAEPTTLHLPRLFKITQGGWEHVSDERLLAAEAAIVDVGPEAVPFLLKKFTAPADENLFSLRYAAGRSLARLASTNSLEPHTSEVVDAIIELIGSTDLSTVYGTLSPLLAIESSSAARAIPALRRACLAADEPGVAKILFSALSRIAGPDEVTTLIRVLKDKTIYDARVRASAANAIGWMGSDGISALPLMLDLLGETTDFDVQYPTISGLAGLGPAANGATLQLLEIMRANHPGSRLWRGAVLALGRVRATQAVPELTVLLQDESLNTSTKQYVVVSLGEIGPTANAAINDLKAISSGSRDSTSGSVQELQSAAVVAIDCINVPQTPQLIQLLLSRVGTELDSIPKDGSYSRGEGIHLSAYFSALVRLGAQDDPKIMWHKATPSWNFDRGGMSQRMISSLTPSQISRSIRSAIYRGSRNLEDFGEYDRIGRWSTDGRILALINAMAIGLEAADPAIRATAADVLFAVGPLSQAATPVLRRHLEDDDPQVSLRVAAALIHAADVSERVKETFIQSAMEVDDDIPLHITRLANNNAIFLAK